MARVTLAMANSSMTRCGRLLSSAMALGTALGSEPPRTSRLPPAPRVATLLESPASAGSSFMGDGGAGFEDDCAAGDEDGAALLGDVVALVLDGGAVAFGKFCGV